MFLSQNMMLQFEFNFSKYDICLVCLWYNEYFIFSLLEKGKQILMKDNLIDEERAKQEEAAQESMEQKLERIGS